MTWKRAVFGIGAPIIFGFLFGFPVSAQEVGSLPSVTESKVFYLDRGFVGRPVSLDLDGGNVNVSWEADDLTAPTILYVEIGRDATSTADGAEIGPTTVQLIWADPYVLSQRGVKVSIADGCQADGWHECVTYVQNVSGWKEAADGRVYGRATVRGGAKKLAYMNAGDASWYKYKNCRCAASVDFPKGTRLLVRRADKPEKFTVVRVNDYGPERDKFPERAIDLDAVAFAELVSLRAGVIEVTVEPLAQSDPRYVLADSLPGPTTQIAPSH